MYKRQQLDQLLFESLVRLPTKFEKFDDVEQLGYCIRLLAIRDSDLAKQVIAPALTETSWLNRYQRSYDFTWNRTLGTANWIDPVWATEVTKRLIENYKYDNSARKIELITATLNESHNIIKQLRSFED